LPLCGLFGGAKVIIISETAKENTKNFRAGWFPMDLSSASLNAHVDGWQVSGMVAAACIGGGFCL